MEKIDLVYILSAGHSGSTLLDLILGSHESIESLGEVINLRRYGDNNRRIYTCGKSFKNCLSNSC